MNHCSKNGIHEHSPNSQMHVQIFHRIATLSSINFPDHGEDGFHVVGCVRRSVEVVVPRCFCILLTFLVNWRTGSVCKVLLPSFTVSGQLVSLCSTRSQLQDCRSLLNLRLLDVTGFHAAFPLTRQGMHLAAALLNSTLRRILNFFSSCSLVSLQLRVSPELRMQSNFSRMRNLSEHEKTASSL